MDPKHRIVTKIPLDALWKEEGEVEARRERFMRKREIAGFIRTAPAEFVVADVGRPLRWISVSEGTAFLKKEAERSIVDDPDEPIDLSRYPEGFALIASEWSGCIQCPIILLEKYH